MGAVAVDGQGFPLQGVPDENGHHSPLSAGFLAGTVGVEGTQHHRGKPVPKVVGERQGLSRQLGSGVGRSGLHGRSLSDARGVLAPIIDHAGGHEDKAARGGTHPLQQVKRSHHISVKGLRRVIQTLLDVDLRRQMIHHGKRPPAPHLVPHGGGTHVPPHQGKVSVFRQMGHVFRTAVAEVVHRHHPFPPGQKGIHQMAPDEPRTASDQTCHDFFLRFSGIHTGRQKSPPREPPHCLKFLPPDGRRKKRPPRYKDRPRGSSISGNRPRALHISSTRHAVFSRGNTFWPSLRYSPGEATQAPG